MLPKNVILASQSPRRKEMLGWVLPTFSAQPADLDESMREDESPAEYVQRLALSKARAVHVASWGQSGVLGADTIVLLEGKVLGKPATRSEALEMLTELRGREHQVLTAIAWIPAGGDEVFTDVCVSRVPMRDYTRQEMLDYIHSGDPYDKAGGYAIQSTDFHPVENFAGCYASVMGMPLCHLKRTLARAGVILEVNLPKICLNHLNYTCFISKRVLQGVAAG